MSLSEFNPLTHMSMTQIDPTCHCDKGSNSEISQLELAVMAQSQVTFSSPEFTRKTTQVFNSEALAVKSQEIDFCTKKSDSFLTPKHYNTSTTSTRLTSVKRSPPVILHATLYSSLFSSIFLLTETKSLLLPCKKTILTNFLQPYKLQPALHTVIPSNIGRSVPPR